MVNIVISYAQSRDEFRKQLTKLLAQYEVRKRDLEVKYAETKFVSPLLPSALLPLTFFCHSHRTFWRTVCELELMRRKRERDTMDKEAEERQSKQEHDKTWEASTCPPLLCTSRLPLTALCMLRVPFAPSLCRSLCRYLFSMVYRALILPPC